MRGKQVAEGGTGKGVVLKRRQACRVGLSFALRQACKGLVPHHGREAQGGRMPHNRVVDDRNWPVCS